MIIQDEVGKNLEQELNNLLKSKNKPLIFFNNYQDHIAIVDDSIVNGKRYTTFYIKGMPRFILPMLNKHRVFSNVAQSSRYCNRLNDAFFNQKYPVNLPFIGKIIFRISCLFSCLLFIIGKKFVRKELLNRLLEPFIGINIYICSSDFDNFFKLRCDVKTDATMRSIACMMRQIYEISIPKETAISLPLILQEELENNSIEDLVYVSAARIARVSYDSRGKDLQADVKLGKNLEKMGHFVPCEFVHLEGYRDYREYLEKHKRL